MGVGRGAAVVHIFDHLVQSRVISFIWFVLSNQLALHFVYFQLQRQTFMLIYLLYVTY